MRQTDTIESFQARILSGDTSPIPIAEAVDMEAQVLADLTNRIERLERIHGIKPRKEEKSEAK